MIPLNSNLTALKRSQIRTFTNLARQTPDCASLTIGEPNRILIPPRPSRLLPLLPCSRGQPTMRPIREPRSSALPLRIMKRTGAIR